MAADLETDPVVEKTFAVRILELELLWLTTSRSRPVVVSLILAAMETVVAAYIKVRVVNIFKIYRHRITSRFLIVDITCPV